VVGRERRRRLLVADPVPRRHPGQPRLGHLHLDARHPARGDGRRGDRGAAHDDGTRPAGPHPHAPAGQPRVHPQDRRPLRGRHQGLGPVGRRRGAGARRVRLRHRDRPAVAHADAGPPARRPRRRRRATGGLGRPAALQHRPGVHRSRRRPHRHRGVPPHPVPQPRRSRGVPLRPGGGRAAPPGAHRRRHLPSAGAHQRRHPAQRPGVQQLLRPARRRRQRHHPLHGDRRSAGSAGQSRSARAAAGGPVTDPGGHRGDPALDHGDDALPAHRHR